MTPANADRTAATTSGELAVVAKLSMLDRVLPLSNSPSPSACLA